MEYLYCSLLGYIIGMANPAYYMGKKSGFDIHEKGSGNPGASNATILFGKARGALCALHDIVKACLAIILAQFLFSDFRHAFAVTAAACILGHIFPLYMRFRGGKGFACLGGVILMFDRRVFLIMLAVELVVALVTDYICFVPMTASAIFPIVYGFMTGDMLGSVLLATTGVVIIVRHSENIRRIRNGMEAHISILWNKHSELERIASNAQEDIETVKEHFNDSDAQ